MKALKITNEKINRILDTLSLCAVLQYCIYRFLQSTMFNFYYSQTYKVVTMGLLLLFGGVRYLMLVWIKLKERDAKEKKVFILKTGFAWTLALPFFYVGFLHDYKVMIFLPICCMCLYDMEAGKVCRWFFVTIGTCLAATVLCCLSGVVRNLTWNGVAAYGIINTTDFASYGTFLLLAAWCGMKNKSLIGEILLVLLVISASVLLYKLTGSKTALFSAVLLVLFTILDYLMTHKSTRGVRVFKHSEKVVSFTTFFFPLIGISVLGLTVLYNMRIPWVTELDQFLSGRLGVILAPAKTYGVKPFGTLIESGHGNGSTLLNWAWTTIGMGYIDTAYAMLAIKYGWIICGIVTSLWVWVSIRATREGNIRYALTMAVLAVHGFSEARILDVNYNIFLVMLFSSFYKEDKKETDLQNARVPAFSIFTGIIICGGVYLALPRLLSLLRTFFYVKGWNSGTAAFFALLLSGSLVLSAWLIWREINRLWQGREPKKQMLINATKLVAVISFIVGSMYAINNEIDGYISRNKDSIKADEVLVRKVLNYASLPVYAAEPSELFQRDVGGLQDHIFSPEQLYYRSRATLITAPTTSAAGIYLQLSDQIALHTYDQAIIDGLTAEGFVWSAFNNARHMINLSDVAVFNERVDIPIILKRGQSIRTDNYPIDQYAGTYEIIFSLATGGSLEEGNVCTLKILGEEGDRVISTRTLAKADFDESGKCKYSIRYEIPDTPKVLYEIEAEDEVVINEISWQRVL